MTLLSPTLLLDPGTKGEQKIHEFSLNDVTMAYGFPLEDPTAGSAEGYIGDDHQFYGVLHLGRYLPFREANYTLYPTHSRVGRRNIVLGHSIPCVE